MKERYFGSVRFFRHLILGTTLILILIPSVLAILFGARVHSLQRQIYELSHMTEILGPPIPLMGGPAPDEPADQGLAAPEVERPPYVDLYPELYAEGVAYDSVNEEKTAYLTFDDGPSSMTPVVLDILEEYGVKATFFTVGRQDSETSRALMRRIVDEGHTIAIHSYSHDYRQIYSSVEAFLADFKAQYDLIYEATGVHPQIYRFPGGSINSYNRRIYQEIIAEMTRRGFTFFDWNVSLEDASAKATVKSMESGLDGVENLRRAIVLIHDSGENVKLNVVLPYVIETIQGAGFTLDRLTPEITPVQFPYPRSEQG